MLERFGTFVQICVQHRAHVKGLQMSRPYCQILGSPLSGDRCSQPRCTTYVGSSCGIPRAKVSICDDVCPQQRQGAAYLSQRSWLVYVCHVFLGQKLRCLTHSSILLLYGAVGLLGLVVCRYLRITASLIFCPSSLDLLTAQILL